MARFVSVMVRSVVVALGLFAGATAPAIAALGGGPYLGGPLSPASPVTFSVPVTGSPRTTTIVVPTPTIDGLRPDPGPTAGPTRPIEGAPTTFTTILKGTPSGDSTLRRSLAPIEPSNELPKPTQCLAQGEYEKTSERANAVWERMATAAESRRGAGASAPRRVVVGDRGASRSSDLGLDSPVRGPARDVFATPSHVVAVPDLESVPSAARGYFSGE